MCARGVSDDDITSVASETAFSRVAGSSDLTFHRIRMSQILLGVQVYMIAPDLLSEDGTLITLTRDKITHS